MPFVRRILVELAALGIGIAWHLGVGQHDMIGHREVVEPHRLAFLPDFVELLRRVVPLNRQAARVWLEILAHRQDVDARAAKIAESLRELLSRLAQTDHHAALHLQRNLLFVPFPRGSGEEFQRPRVDRIRPDALVEARDGLGVVVEDLGPLVENDRQC